jgi:hypothetical protein
MQALAPVMDDHVLGRNEATTRLQLIDRLLFDCLGWEREEAELEDHEAGEFADYVLDRRGRHLVVEAKREGAWFVLPNEIERIVRLETLRGLDNVVADAVDQVSGYAQKRGIPYAVACNGHQLIAFVGSRQDGVSPDEGRALVFASPADLLEGFAELWDVLSRQGAATRRLTRRLGAVAAAPPPKLSEQIAAYPGTAPGDEQQYQLATLHVLFLPDYVRDDEKEVEFLERCYCPPGAFSHLAALNRAVLRARYSKALGQELKVGLEEARQKEGLNPQLREEVAATTAGRQPIVLLGDVGVGKTMFLRRLLRVDARELADDAVMLYVDLGRSAVLQDIPSYTTAAFKQQLYERYDIDIDASDFLRGTYHTEVRRFAKGVDMELAKLDPPEFKRREIDHLKELASQTEDHLRRSLEHLVKLRRKQVIVVLDNIDQRSIEDQEEVFLIAETIATRWPCTTFVTLRPETFNASRVSGALSGYQPRAFTIEPPRVERVVIQRLKFGDDHYREHDALPSWLGWTAESDAVRRYLEILLKSFRRNEHLQEALINLSGGNVRRALELLTTFVDSPHADPNQTLERNAGNEDYIIPHHLFLRAVLLGNTVYYDPESSRIPNLFDLSTIDSREHFLLPCLLGVLRTGTDRRDTEGFVPIEDIMATLQDAGFGVDQVEFAVRRGVGTELMDALPPDGNFRALRLTTVGAYVQRELAREFQYHDVIAVDMPITDPAVRQEIADVKSIRQRLDRCDRILTYLDTCWTNAGLEELGLFDWPGCAAGVRSEIQYVRDRL